MKLKKILAIIGVLLLLFLAFAWLFDEGETSPAPGCESNGGITGCLGKSFIHDASLSPSFDCLHLKPNNCNGGVLGVENKCESDFTLGSVIISAGEYALVELVRSFDGTITVIAPEGNFDSYNPAESDELSVQGALGNEAVTLSYVKENVCGEPKG